jgi:hypothetical protein
MPEQHVSNSVQQMQQMDEHEALSRGNMEVNHGNASLEDQRSILRDVQL